MTLDIIQLRLRRNHLSRLSYKLKSQENESKSVSLKTSSLHYDTIDLVIGSIGSGSLYGVPGSCLPTLKVYKVVKACFPSAKYIIFVGGGSACPEKAGELGYLHGKSTKSAKDTSMPCGY